MTPHTCCVYEFESKKKMSSVSYDFFCKCVLFILLINKNKTSIVLFIQRIWRANILYDVHIPWEMMARAKFTTMNQPTTHARHSRIRFENEWKFICWEKPKVLGMSLRQYYITTLIDKSNLKKGFDMTSQYLVYWYFFYLRFKRYPSVFSKPLIKNFSTQPTSLTLLFCNQQTILIRYHSMRLYVYTSVPCYYKMILMMSITVLNESLLMWYIERRIIDVKDVHLRYQAYHCFIRDKHERMWMLSSKSLILNRVMSMLFK